MQGNIIGQSGTVVNDSLFPIYQQLNQPLEYNGIWIKEEENLENIYFQTDDDREYEEINDLPYDFYKGRACSIGTDIYLFGGYYNNGCHNNAYKFNTKDGTYTKLTNIPSACEDGAVLSTNTSIYISCKYDSFSYIYEYNPETDEYTCLESITFLDFIDHSMVKVDDNSIYFFGSSLHSYYSAVRYEFAERNIHYLCDIPDNFGATSAIAINDNEICLLGVRDDNNDYRLYKYNIAENEYTLIKGILGLVPSYAKIGNCAYLLESFLNRNSGVPILTKYNLRKQSLYQYGNNLDAIGRSYSQIVSINNDLYLLTKTKLYKFKILVDYVEDGIYVISQETSLSKNLDVNNILDVKKIVNKTEQNIVVYVGDGNSWKLLNSSDIVQTTNTLQYALSFKEGN